MIEVFTPKLFIIEANSQPITPPPMMAKVSGKVDRLRIPVEDRILTSSRAIPGRDFGSEPVAITTY